MHQQAIGIWADIGAALVLCALLKARFDAVPAADRQLRLAISVFAHCWLIATGNWQMTIGSVCQSLAVVLVRSIQGMRIMAMHIILASVI